MKMISIETSCDETAAAIVGKGTKILSSSVASSLEMHSKTGGVIPENAAREQVKYIIPVLRETIEKLHSDLSFNEVITEEIDALAVTTGPGLIGSLLIGVETAKTIAALFNKPIIPVNHVLAHVYANFLENPKAIVFPALSLIVSGGHTELFLMENIKSMKWLGGTRDDAAGEAFDKIARLLGLGYPGGPAIAAEAQEFRIKNHESRIKLPRPMLDSDSPEFSFSGLKTAVLREVNNFKTMKQFNNEAIQNIAFETQEAITDVLVKKTLATAEKYNVSSILLGGGVSANFRLKEKFLSTINNQQSAIQFFSPSPSLCTDNAAYIAGYAFFHYTPLPWHDIQAHPDLSVEV